MKAKYQPVMVEWDDARSSSGWFTMNELKNWREDWKSRTIISCGLLSNCDDNAVVLVKSKDLHDRKLRMASMPLEIPRVMVKAIVALPVPKRFRDLERKDTKMTKGAKIPKGKGKKRR